MVHGLEFNSYAGHERVNIVEIGAVPIQFVMAVAKVHLRVPVLQFLYRLNANGVALVIVDLHIFKFAVIDGKNRTFLTDKKAHPEK